MGSLWASDITGLNFEANTSTFKCIRFRGLQDLGEAGPRFVRLAFAASNGGSWGSAFDKRAGSEPSLHQTPKSGMRDFSASCIRHSEVHFRNSRRKPCVFYTSIKRPLQMNHVVETIGATFDRTADREPNG